MGQLQVLLALNEPALCWEILENEPNAKFKLVVLKTAADQSMERIDQPFDPLTDEGTEIVNAFGKPVQLVDTRIWIAVNIPTHTKDSIW